ncbi:unnamed protein product, partial [Rotaria socialis]
MSTKADHLKNEPHRHTHLLARSFLLSLEPEHRRILRDALIHVENPTLAKTKQKEIVRTFEKATGLGNAISDVMRIDFADRIERASGRILALFGIDLPKLMRAQWRLRSVHITQLS